MEHLEWCSPLVFAGEIRGLSNKLAYACHGQEFFLVGGDCDESLEEFDVDHVRDTFRVMLQMVMVLTFGEILSNINV